MSEASRTGAARAVTRPLEEASRVSSTGCDALGKASIKCIEDHDYNRSHPECKKHYDAYKECRKEESRAKREQNLKNQKSIFG